MPCKPGELTARYRQGRLTPAELRDTLSVAAYTQIPQFVNTAQQPSTFRTIPPSHMENIEKLLPRQLVRCKVRAHSRKRTLDIAADLMAEQYPGISARRLFQALMKRERLGSTGLGKGVAIPHCRLDCPGMMAALFSLQRPVDYYAPDDQAVDLVFVLVVPRQETSAHLEALAMITSVFHSTAARVRLRQARNARELRARFLKVATGAAT